MFENMTKTRVYALLIGVFSAFIIVSNILGTKTLEIGWIMLPCSILAFPVLYIVNDILSEIYGFKLTKDVIYLGFILNILAVFFYTVAILMPSSSSNADAFAIILGTTPRLLIAGLISYIVGSIMNSWVLVKLKERYADWLFVRCITSTAIGEALDSLIFISIAFIGTMPIVDVGTMICCQVIFKVLYELVCYPVTRRVILAIRKLPDGELEDQI